MADDIDIEAMLEAPYKKGEMCDRGDIKLLQPFNENERRSREWHRSQEIHSGWLLA
uniref:RNA-binding protein 39 n=1 Tax=Accipiter nisus TaxID=211598 RepID=A0A8B9RPC6_9AVES